VKKEILKRMDVVQGDITRMEVDAIVNAANTSLLGGGGVDGAIHRAAGPELLEECKTIGGCPTGEARLTKGYNLPASHVIHTVGPVYNLKQDNARLLSGCYKNSLEIAASHSIRSIAFPAISCGVYGYPIKEACKVAVDTTAVFLEDHDVIKKVFFVLFSQSEYEVYMDYLGVYGG
jgi:O-acetyl-ADP-ribose deacetylase (regulator of RNase III)